MYIETFYLVDLLGKSHLAQRWKKNKENVPLNELQHTLKWVQLVYNWFNIRGAIITFPFYGCERSVKMHAP